MTSAQAEPLEVDRPYRVAEVARVLDCSEQHVRDMVRQDRIPGAFRVGKLIRFVRPTVDAWLAARVQAGNGTAAGTPAAAGPDAPPAEVAFRATARKRTPTRTATTPPPVAAASHAPDFAEVRWFGTDFRFDPPQRAAVALLWRAWDAGTAFVPMAELLDATGTRHIHLRAVFDGGTHPAWGAMIETATLAGGPKGAYMLHPPASDRRAVA